MSYISNGTHKFYIVYFLRLFLCKLYIMIYVDLIIIRRLLSNFDWQRLLFVKLYRKTILVLIQNPSCKPIVSMSAKYVYINLLRFWWNSRPVLCIHKFNYNALTYTKNWLMVCMTSIRYTGPIRVVSTYVQRAAIRTMCVKFQQKSLKLRD